MRYRKNFEEGSFSNHPRNDFRSQHKIRQRADKIRRTAIEKLNADQRLSKLKVNDYVCICSNATNSKISAFQRSWHGPYKLAFPSYHGDTWIARGRVCGKIIERTARADLVKPFYDIEGRHVNDPNHIPTVLDQPTPQINADPSTAAKRRLPGRPPGSRKKNSKMLKR